MKTAIASEGRELSSDISIRGGRAPYYLIVEEGKILEIIKNPFALGSGGAGWSVAHLLAEKGVSHFIAGKVGGNMTAALKEKGISFEERSGKVKEAL